MADQKVNETKESQATKNKPGPRKPHVGETVHYWKSRAQSNGSYVIEPLAAIISGTKVSGGNFQEKDMVVNLWIFSDKQGAGLEQKSAIMHSEKPQDGRWGFLPL